VVVAREGIPAPTGHDRTALVIYQRADEPGSLISILQEFAARRINLSNLLSRPTKDGGLGDYCFVVYADGHVADELLADAMRALRAKQGKVKFLGSATRPRARRARDALARGREFAPTPAGATPTTGSGTTGMKAMGKVVSAVRAKAGQTADGAVIAALVKAALSA
jgi:hypothetical protein